MERPRVPPLNLEHVRPAAEHVRPFPLRVLDRILLHYFPQPTKAKFAIVDKQLWGLLRDPAMVFFRKFGDLTPAQQKSALALGWTEELWPGGPAATRWQGEQCAEWGSVGATDQEHWKRLGYSESTWALFGQERYHYPSNTRRFPKPSGSFRRYRLFEPERRGRCPTCRSYYWVEGDDYTPRCYCGWEMFFQGPGRGK